MKSIKKQHLVEVRSMANPPAAVKLALESICLLLGESTTDWKQIRSIIMRENFIPTIVNFSAEEIRCLPGRRRPVGRREAFLFPPGLVCEVAYARRQRQLATSQAVSTQRSRLLPRAPGKSFLTLNPRAKPSLQSRGPGLCRRAGPTPCPAGEGTGGQSP